MFKICYLNLNKLSSTLERYFDKCVASHILNSIIIVIHLFIGFSFLTLAFPKHSFFLFYGSQDTPPLTKSDPHTPPPHIFILLPFVNPLPHLLLPTWTPSCVSCMNSKSLLTTVLRNLQWALRKRGYCPTMYMMLEAMMALLSFPFFCSHNPNRS